MEDDEEYEEIDTVEVTEEAERMIDARCLIEEKAFEFLVNTPNCDKYKLAKHIITKYWMESFDAYGPTSEKICESLLNLWNTPYYNANCVEEHTFKEWAIYFSTPGSIDRYMKSIEHPRLQWQTPMHKDLFPVK